MTYFTPNPLRSADTVKCSVGLPLWNCAKAIDTRKSFTRTPAPNEKPAIDLNVGMSISARRR